MTSGIGGAARPAISPDGTDAGLHQPPRRRHRARGAHARDRRRARAGPPGSRTTTRKASRPWTSGPTTPSRRTARRWSTAARAGCITWRSPWARRPGRFPFTAPVSIALAPTVTRQDRVPQEAVEAKILRRAQQSPDGQTIVFEAFGRVLGAAARGRTRGRRATTPDLHRVALPRVHAGDLPRRAERRLCARGATPRAARCGEAAARRRRLDADAPHHGGRALRQPRVVAHRRPAGGRARVGPRVPRAAAGRRELLRAALAARHRRRAAAGHHRRAAGRHALSSPAALEQRRHAAALRPRGRAQEPRRGPEGRSRLDTSRRHRPEDAAAPAAGRRPGAVARWTVAGLHRARSDLRHGDPVRQVEPAPEVGTKEGSVPVWLLSDDGRQLRGLGRRRRRA